MVIKEEWVALGKQSTFPGELGRINRYLAMPRLQ